MASSCLPAGFTLRSEALGPGLVRCDAAAGFPEGLARRDAAAGVGLARRVAKQQQQAFEQEPPRAVKNGQTIQGVRAGVMPVKRAQATPTAADVKTLPRGVCRENITHSVREAERIFA